MRHSQKIQNLARHEIHQILNGSGHEIEPRRERSDDRPRFAESGEVKNVDVTQGGFAMSQNQFPAFLERYRRRPLNEAEK